VNLLVVGATGFIGRHLVQRLADSGHDVTLPQRLARRRLFPGLPCVAADYGRDSAETRIPQLADFMIKAAGLIRETGDRRPALPRGAHRRPIALFAGLFSGPC
jgi:nucleoside-diphosphate-sugar epimerase